MNNLSLIYCTYNALKKKKDILTIYFHSPQNISGASQQDSVLLKYEKKKNNSGIPNWFEKKIQGSVNFIVYHIVTENDL